MENLQKINNEVVVFEDGSRATDLMGAINGTSKTQMLVTMKAETRGEKVKLYNAIQNPQKKLEDMIKEELNLCHAICHQVELIDEKTGEATQQIRSILIDENGVSYSCVSGGVANSLAMISQLFGNAFIGEVDWSEEPIRVKVVQEKTRNGNNKVMKLELVDVE